MTKLQILISFLSDTLDQSVLDDIILDNFSNQDSNSFEVSNYIYHVLDNSEVADTLEQEIEEKVYSFIESIQESKEVLNSYFTKYINTRHLIREILDNSDHEDVEQFEFLGDFNGSYIFRE